jgi:cytochrome c oxidase subunit I+III
MTPPDTPHDALPSALPRPADELARLEKVWELPRGWRALSAVNNTRVGQWYVATALLFFLLAGVLALLMRAQLALPGGSLLSATTYNQVFTMHGTVMMFLFAVPVVEAVAVYLLPGMLGARDLPFPRLSAYAYWAYAIGGLVFFGTLFFGVAPDGGWFMYPPLTGTTYSPGDNADWWLLGIGFIEISAIAGAIELIVGVLMTRAPGMTPARMPIFAWAMLVVGVMIVFAFPAIIAGTTLLELERAFDWPIFVAERGGDPLLWQHLFWFFGHPEVYIIFLPAAGLVSMIVAVVARRPLAGYGAVVAALIAVGVISFALWLHHMFTAGFGRFTTLLVSAASLAIALPSGVQVFAWIATLRHGVPRLTVAAWFLLAFLFTFVAGGLTGVMVAVLPFDAQVHDTYFIVAHLHYVLIGGMVFPLFAAFYHWAPLLNGHALGERAGRWVCALMFAGFHVAFFPMHALGLLGMPRRVYSYDAASGWAALNLLSTAGAFVLAGGVVLFVVDAWRTLRRPKREHGNPWQAGTLEWLPQHDYGTRSIPRVTSREPLWDRPSLATEVPAGQHWLPGSATGARETLVTGIVDARPRHLLVLPGYGWSPFVAAAGTAAFFLLLTVKLVWPAFAAGAVALAATWRWLWASDPKPAAAEVEIGTGVWVPAKAYGRASHSWWAMVVLLAVDATVFASLLFAHLHLALQADVCPPPGARLADAAWPLAAGALLLAGSAALALARRALHAPRVLLPLLVGLGMACAAAAFGAEWIGQREAGLDPRLHGWSATVAALYAYQGVHVALLLLMGAFVCARALAGRLGPTQRAAIDCSALMWHYTAVQGIAIAVVVNRLPGWLA